MAAKRCSRCGIDWPPGHKFAVCPVCEERTDGITGGSPLTLAEADRRVREIQFEKFYEQTWVAKRVGPDPEELGKAEAAEITRQLREIQELPGV